MIHNTRGLGTIFPRIFNAPNFIVGIVGVADNGGFASAVYRYTYDGYFNDNLNFFSTTSVVSSERTYNATAYFNTRNLRSEQTLGFFKPSATGTTTICVTSDDACYIWLGTAAYNPTSANAFIKCPGIHNVNTVNARASAEAILSSDLYYPIRIYYGNNTVNGSFAMSVTMPGYPLTYNIASNLFNNTSIFNI